MRNSLKVAKWEIKRNMSNKSFIISLLLTPVLFMIFFFVPSLFGGNDSEEMVKVYMLDELNVWNEVEDTVIQHGLFNWDLEKTDMKEAAMQTAATDSEQTVFIALTEDGLEQGQIHMYMSADVDESFQYEAIALEEPLRQMQIERLGLTAEQKEIIASRIVIEPVNVEELSNGEETIPADEEAVADPLKRAVPGIFAGIILFSIVMTGMMIFQSASQEKKEKVAEIILSSLTPSELMQGKIIGYFVLGITQVIVWLVFLIPLVIWKMDIPLLEYLLVPELLLFLFIAFAGYFLFAAIFVGIGATVEELTATSNFQGMIMMLPFLPFLFIAPIMSDPSGLIAKIGSFIPITSPAILLVRLSMLEEWPWTEVIISLIILLASIWLFMKLAGKIFKIGILMYGKNATPKEIWKWMWA
ncbi:ABC transporter permease [Lederbergia lenta]|uniref:ABC transporter NatB-like protein permease n=1 Tax=Lederbergia lenta TaxID=1467 RepID=A0A2X4VKV5_LEDLE|nr:ABC transporter permease [Lederbergia lenta]MEC2323700.1 ABC transporter permease [Lederbergia lenta]SQI51603.1 ABC transporter NatB-like protein permease [Lederbergia lenta]